MPYRNAPDSEREQRLFPLVLSALRTPMLRPGEALVGRAERSRPAGPRPPSPVTHIGFVIAQTTSPRSGRPLYPRSSARTWRRLTMSSLNSCVDSTLSSGRMSTGTPSAISHSGRSIPPRTSTRKRTGRPSPAEIVSPISVSTRPSPPAPGRDRVAHQRLETAVAIGVGGEDELRIIRRVRNEDVPHADRVEHPCFPGLGVDPRRRVPAAVRGLRLRRRGRGRVRAADGDHALAFAQQRVPAVERLPVVETPGRLPD